MATIDNDRLPWLSRASTGYDLFTKTPENPTSYPSLFTNEDEDATVAPMRVMAHRGTEIFVARGNEVRCADLQDLKARYTPKPGAQEDGHREYKVCARMLDLPGLDFEIHQLEISRDGFLLAIVGEKELAVCVLPAEGLARVDDAKLRVPAFYMVGPNYHNAEKGSRIVRAIWHPLGVEGASLVVLTSESVVRTYDFTIGQDFTFEIPDQTLDLYTLSGRTRHNGGFFADEEEMEAASCCFGDGHQGWRPFTLYILMRGGDIYALTPVVPSRWKAPREYLQSLSLDINWGLENLEDDVTMEEKLVLRQQTKWINDVLNQEANIGAVYAGSAISPRKKASTCLVRPGVVGATPQLQGPFLFQPAPQEISTDEYGCDIFHIESDPVGVIGILFSNGKVDICLEPESLKAKWVDKRIKRKGVGEEPDQPPQGLPIISGYETIDLGFSPRSSSSTISWPVFSRDPQSNQVWYINHNLGVATISMKTWLSKLATVLDGDEDDDFIAKSMEKNPQSTIYKPIQNTNKPHSLARPIIGSIAIYEAYLGYLLIAATKVNSQSVEFEDTQGRASGVDSPASSKTIRSPAQQSTLPPPPKPLTHYRGHQRRPSLLTPHFTFPPELTTPSVLHSLLKPTNPQHKKLLTSPIHFTTETNALLRAARDTLKTEYDRIMEIAQEMYDRAATQRIEFRKQLESIHRAGETLNRLESRNVRARLERFLTRQEELQARADEVLKILIVKNELGVSDAEKKWFKEVAKVEEKIGSSHPADGQDGDGDGDEEEDSTTLTGRKKIVARLAGELCPLVDEHGNNASAGPEGRRRMKMVVGRGDDVPEEVRVGKLRILKELLEREDALVKATRKRLEGLELEAERA
ncbi:hypothetical protein L873DRAFT_1848718 [Choiromyces venosus 120613-1]|uniref:Nucleoporin Nup82 n=1 Tax=Choiromyces venosus 120613-1 TaxID=1336337 RepID=A0A3N4JA23_9PEZI|nr:hypothetical protein L873DRAFT_1848718 [Choiromyces venosus 120613-1]